MTHPIPVWQTLSDSFAFVIHNMGLLCKALIIPILLYIAIEMIFLFIMMQSGSPLLILKSLLELVIYAWMLNIACRVVITEHIGSYKWSSAETWTSIWLVFLTLVISLLAGAVSLGVFGLLVWVDQILAMSAALFTFMVLHVYLFARFVLIFPAIAMGHRAAFRDAWDLSAGNGWRLVMLFFLVPFLYSLLAVILGILLPLPLFHTLLAFIAIFFCLVGVVAISMAYKQLH